MKYYGTTNFDGRVDSLEEDNGGELFSMFVLRIDKINSNILIYTRKLSETGSILTPGLPKYNKYQGLRRSDRVWNYINDKNNFFILHFFFLIVMTEENFKGL